MEKIDLNFFQSEEETAKNFLTKCKRDNISTDYPELKNIKFKRNYDSLIWEILHANFVEDNENYKSMSKDEILYISLNIVATIVGDAFSKEEIFSIASLVLPTDREDVMDGYCCDITMMDKITNEQERLDIIFVPKMNITASILCTVHEIFHYLENPKRIQIANNYRYNETMSEFGEYYAAYLLEQHGIEPCITSKIEQLRLASIQFQQRHLDFFKKQDAYFKHLFKIDPEARELYNYEVSRNYAYLMGFVYRTSLFNCFLDDKKAFLQNMNAMYKGEKTLSELLAYYGIDLRRNKTREEALQVIKRYKP